MLKKFWLNSHLVAMLTYRCQKFNFRKSLLTSLNLSPYSMMLLNYVSLLCLPTAAEDAHHGPNEAAVIRGGATWSLLLRGASAPSRVRTRFIYTNPVHVLFLFQRIHLFHLHKTHFKFFVFISEDTFVSFTQNPFHVFISENTFVSFTQNPVHVLFYLQNNLLVYYQ